MTICGQAKSAQNAPHHERQADSREQPIAKQFVHQKVHPQIEHIDYACGQAPLNENGMHQVHLALSFIEAPLMEYSYGACSVFVLTP